VVLIIVSVLLGGILLPLNAQQDIRLQAEAETAMNEARDAIVGFAQINGRLPCPTFNPTGNGKEDCTGNPFGFLPWGELGVRQTDPWGRVYRYRVSTTFMTVPPPITTATAGDLKIQTRQGVALIDLTNDAAPRDVVFVILSHGKNGIYGTNGNGSPAPADPVGFLNPDEDTNAGTLANLASTVFVSRPPSPEGAPTIGAFDDLVVWVPRSLMINRLVAAGKL
jgi:type II secretory pathway pseudopilin PulG